MSIVTEKSEILYLYEAKYTIPNGDPFTGEPRYDEETKRALVSDVRLKRYIRDNMHQNGHTIYVINPDLDNKMTSGQRFKYLYDEYLNSTKEKTKLSPREFALSIPDVRMFGGVMAIQQEKKGKKQKDSEADDNNPNSENKATAFNVTGAIQFAILNPSLNAVNLMMNQRTSVFVSSAGNEQGSIATRYIVPYALMQVHGWINPFNAAITQLTESDVQLMLKSLWDEVNGKNTTSKVDQTSLLILQIIYNKPNDKIYGIDKVIKILSEKQDEQIRSLNDMDLDFTDLENVVKSDKVKAIKYYTEIERIESKLKQFESEKIQKLIFE
jgi:CRISPR-associated protein Csh2